MNVLVAVWFPMAEKSTAIAIATTGNQVSVIVAMFLTAELCLLSLPGGWAWAFHVYGIIGVFFCVIWVFIVSDSPSRNKYIKQKEANIIAQCEHSRHIGPINPREVPWSNILSSMTVWSTALCAFSQSFMTVGTVVYLPSYYKSVLRMNLASNGLMSALPFVIQLVTKIFFAAVADEMKKRKLLSPTQVTKLFNFIGSFGAGGCFALLSFCDCSHPYLAITLAVTAIGLSSGFIPGYNTSIVVIAPRYTSAVASFCRLLAQIASVASPWMIGMIVTEGTADEWKMAFWMMTVILTIAGVLFQIFGSASIQNWAIPLNSQNKPDDTKLKLIS